MVLSVRESFCPFNIPLTLLTLQYVHLSYKEHWAFSAQAQTLSWIFASSNSLKTFFLSIFTEQILLQSKKNISQVVAAAKKRKEALMVHLF